MVALAQLAAAMLRVSRNHEGLMLERGIGYWITSDGDLLPVPPRIAHAEMARQMIDADALNEQQRESFMIDPNAFVFTLGWSRFRIYPDQHVCYLDLGQGQRSNHLKHAEELLEQLDLSGIAIKYTDEDGNYVS